jgi:hypothetical protein
VKEESLIAATAVLMNSSHLGIFKIKYFFRLSLILCIDSGFQDTLLALGLLTVEESITVSGSRQDRLLNDQDQDQETSPNVNYVWLNNFIRLV